MLDQSLVGQRDPVSLRNAWRSYRDENPKVRIRDAATALGVSEAELVATGVGDTAVRLVADWAGLVQALPSLGTVMALTRNDHCVHEKVGRYDKVSVGGHGGIVLDPDIDLRLFFGRWHHAFAVVEETQIGPRRSLQIFDRDGTAVHKVYLREESDNAAYEALLQRFTHAEQQPDLKVEPAAPEKPEKPDAEIDVAGFVAGWRALADTHDFFPLLRKHGVARTQAFRLVPDELARRVSDRAFSRALELAAESEVPVMIFVGSPGVIQIHTGPVKRVQRVGPWQNVLDPGFNLHLREEGIATTWLVRKPTSDGTVTSLEIFDAVGRQIAWLFGKRKPGQPEAPEWPALAERAVADPSSAAAALPLRRVEATA